MKNLLTRLMERRILGVLIAHPGVTSVLLQAVEDQLDD